MVVPGDLDIYVPSRSANQLKRILKCTIHGLVHLKGEDLKAFGKRESGSYCTIPGLEKIWYFWVPKKGTLINVLVTSTESAVAAVIAFHSTTVMNLLTYFGVVSLYAETTSRRVGWVNGKYGMRNKDVNWMRKYRSRGFRCVQDTLSTTPHKCGQSIRCTQTVRRLDDEGVEIATFREYWPMNRRTLLNSIEPVFMWKLRNNRCREPSNVEDGWVLTDTEFLRLD
ncbi:hypothetical protein BKA70DRAFT_1218608 [Coprinopsis sp. MPI-PUGE-AT-0042]|nr:hypothetical protein BKA70DRAFT_1243497 [Coprinopsis sp. MPI-PUGE-AT-0042]KAH6871020.1 hypothetical protein BKA70DRAFT_1242090 [Coprinopsis sp. MPI-PUGE-AT-0042]KAH6880907.1 hypothetical protein BKA70DRAFT_1238716 [Coprinopsis sp. MPI-PUGE-AT-0042]KAH6904833.1 hypothetical protein BKA70DRAFT_1431845 [Coprinopsis sp. MPI-PUGE-AT-0042]KAH6913708.1 hypothetical protein BKA70DRAFT_1218608 [Coprinopsis sp. MPI-PUGE-AT-0042]